LLTESPSSCAGSIVALPRDLEGFNPVKTSSIHDGLSCRIW